MIVCYKRQTRGFCTKQFVQIEDLRGFYFQKMLLLMEISSQSKKKKKKKKIKKIHRTLS